MKRKVVSGCGTLSLMAVLFVSEPAKARDRLEAVIAPQVGLSFGHDELAGKGSRQAFRLDFARISTGVSLNTHFGRGLDYIDFGGVLRLFDGLELSAEDWGSTAAYFGVGFGAFYSPGVALSTTKKDRKAPFTDFVVNPFTRVQWDINGRVGLFLDLSYEMVPHREYWKDGSNAGRVKHHFVVSLGVPIEIER